MILDHCTLYRELLYDRRWCNVIFACLSRLETHKMYLKISAIHHHTMIEDVLGAVLVLVVIGLLLLLLVGAVH